MATLIYGDTSIYPKRRNTRTSSARIKLRAYTAAKWQETNFKLAENELAYDKTNRQLKIGDGVTHWNELPFLNINLSGNFAGVASIEELNSLATILNSSNALHDGRLDVLEGRDVALTNLINSLGLRVDTLETEGAGGGNVDLSDYATLAQLETVQGSISGIAQSNNSQQSQINDLINRTTALENEPATTVDLTAYATIAALNALADTINTLAGRVTYLEQNGGGGSGGGGGVVVYPVVPFNQNYDVTMPQLATKTLEFTVEAGAATVKGVYLLQATANYTDFYGSSMRGLKFELLDEFGAMYITQDAPASGNNMFFKWTGLNLSAGRYIIKITHTSNSEPQNRRVYLGT